MEVVAEKEELLEGVLGKGIDSPNYYYRVFYGKVDKVNWLWNLQISIFADTVGPVPFFGTHRTHFININ